MEPYLHLTLPCILIEFGHRDNSTFTLIMGIIFNYIAAVVLLGPILFETQMKHVEFLKYQ
jgi:hypothetical protein